MTNVHVHGRDMDLFKRVFWGEMSQAANPWHAYHDCVIDLIQQTRLIEKIDIHRRCILYNHISSPVVDHRPRLGSGDPASHSGLLFISLLVFFHLT